MKARRLVAAVTVSGAAAAMALVVLRRGLGPLHLDHGSALRLVIHSGGGYPGPCTAAAAAAAGAQRQQLREDLALRTHQGHCTAPWGR